MKLGLDKILLKQLRMHKKWSQEDLASISNLGIRTIQRAEAGRDISLETAKTLASVLEFELVDLEIKEDHKVMEKNKNGIWFGITGSMTGTFVGLSMVINSSSLPSFSALNEQTSGGLGWGLTGLVIGCCCALAGYLSHRLKSE